MTPYHEYKHILVATDFSDCAERTAAQAVELARSLNARLTLLHVLAYFPEDIPTKWIPREDQDPAEYLRARADEELAKLAERVDAADAQRVVVTSTRAAKYAIKEAARERQADLIVLGNCGRGGMAPWLGSTASGVLHGAPCDVLVVGAERPAASDEQAED